MLVGGVVSVGALLIWISCALTGSALPALSKARYLTVVVAGDRERARVDGAVRRASGRCRRSCSGSAATPEPPARRSPRSVTETGPVYAELAQAAPLQLIVLVGGVVSVGPLLISIELRVDRLGVAGVVERAVLDRRVVETENAPL